MCFDHKTNKDSAKMSSVIDWAAILEKKYPSYMLEVETFLDTIHISRSNDVSMIKIYEVILHDPNIDEVLKMMYEETIYGKNKDVKLRMRNRVANFRCSLK